MRVSRDDARERTGTPEVVAPVAGRVLLRCELPWLALPHPNFVCILHEMFVMVEGRPGFLLSGSGVAGIPSGGAPWDFSLASMLRVMDCRPQGWHVWADLSKGEQVRCVTLPKVGEGGFSIGSK